MRASSVASARKASPSATAMIGTGVRSAASTSASVSSSSTRSSATRASPRTSSSSPSTSAGPSKTASASVRAVARLRAPWSPTPWTSPPSTRYRTASCSRGSSLPNVPRCPISIWTSTMSGASRSSSMFDSSMAPRRSPTSSPTPPSRPSRPSTTLPVCWTIPSTWASASPRWSPPTRA